MRFWQCISYSHPAEMTALARAAEAAGFHGVTLAEHLLHPLKLESKHPYTPEDAPAFEINENWAEVMTSFAAMAAVTERLHFASAVQILPLHNPFYLAKAFASLAQISGDRVALGAGVGWMREEFETLGMDFTTRGRRFDEMVELMRAIWTQDPVRFDGRFYRTEGAVMRPLPRQPVPIYTGGRSEVALRRAARLADGWLSTGERIEESLALIAQLQTYRREYGREHLPFRAFTMQPWGSYGEAELKRLSDAGFTDMINWTFKFVMPENAPSLQQCVDYMQRTAEAIRERFGSLQ